MSQCVGDPDLQAQIESANPGSHKLNWQGFSLLLCKQAWGELILAEQGGQVLHFRPAGQRPVLWLTDQPQRPGRALRGGVPLCWPWFGNHPSDPSQPPHGLARTALWDIETVHLDQHGGRWRLSPQTPLWPGLQLSQFVDVVDGQLSIRLETLNQSDRAVTISQALHSYLAVSDLSQVALRGLQGCDYVDKLQQMAAGRQAGAIRIDGEIDRIFSHRDDGLLVDPGWRRAIRIGKANSGSTVVWNPAGAAALMADVGLAQASRFVCIEAANTGPFDPLQLEPGAAASLQTTISVEALPED
ncbi:D-hexose-6-phosphate mutarotase [Marinobacterium arenosum]|uniref:D-hexose-6-phosphate mutarotase n=1 Tax=Marinobacterium arenosum TaxID=2862496 RepID=UPI001C94903A|nr:D-hexose-6-phosphate mutarotase [Marinobacterium arenosum]MBY4677238.1 D-hexose-6-phosphate mutarotase [Marinobacterium arenosum]